MIWVSTVKAMNMPVDEPAKVAEPPESMTASGTTGRRMDQAPKAAAMANMVAVYPGTFQILVSWVVLIYRTLLPSTRLLLSR